MNPSAPVLMMTPGTLRQYLELRSPLEIPTSWFTGGRGIAQARTLRRMRSTITRYVISGLLPSEPPWIPWSDEDIDHFAGLTEHDATRVQPDLDRYIRDGGVYEPVVASDRPWLDDIQFAITPEDLRSLLPSAVFDALAWSTHERPMASEDVYAAAAYLATWEADRDFVQRRVSAPAAVLAKQVRDRLRIEVAPPESTPIEAGADDRTPL